MAVPPYRPPLPLPFTTGLTPVHAFPHRARWAVWQAQRSVHRFQARLSASLAACGFTVPDADRAPEFDGSGLLTTGSSPTLDLGPGTSLRFHPAAALYLGGPGRDPRGVAARLPGSRAGTLTLTCTDPAWRRSRSEVGLSVGTEEVFPVLYWLSSATATLQGEPVRYDRAAAAVAEVGRALSRVPYVLPDRQVTMAQVLFEDWPVTAGCMTEDGRVRVSGHVEPYPGAWPVVEVGQAVDGDLSGLWPYLDRGPV